MSRELAKKHGFRIAKHASTRRSTLGGDKLAVAGVLSIGEHGNYPYTKDTQSAHVSAAAILRRHRRDLPQEQASRAGLQRQAPRLRLGRRQAHVRHGPRDEDSVPGRFVGAGGAGESRT